MFEPDGRNDIQYVGHQTMTLLRWVCMAFALACILPVFLVVKGRETMKRQDAAIDAANTDPRLQTLTIDFNTPTLGTYDVAVYLAWLNLQASIPEIPDINNLDAYVADENGVLESKEDHDSRVEAGRMAYDRAVAANHDRILDPSLQSLPFTVTFKGEAPKLPTAWVYYNLPYHPWMVSDHYLDEGRAAGVAGPWVEPLDQMEMRQTQQAVNRLRHPDMATSSMDDPWFNQGLYKMGPTKWWDWYTGQQLLQAKASHNYAAYVGAARAVAHMRLLVAKRTVPGIDLEPTATVLVPTRVLAQLPSEDRLAFAQAYRSAFKGKLPVVDVQVQPLDGGTLLHDPTFKEWAARVGETGWRQWGEWHAITTAPFMTGMARHGFPMGRPEYSRTEYLYRSAPVLNDESVAAQRALAAMVTWEFWEPLLKGEGCTSDQLDRARAIIEGTRQGLALDRQFARLHGHEVFYHTPDF